MKFLTRACTPFIVIAHFSSLASAQAVPPGFVIPRPPKLAVDCDGVSYWAREVTRPSGLNSIVIESYTSEGELNTEFGDYSAFGTHLPLEIPTKPGHGGGPAQILHLPSGDLLLVHDRPINKQPGAVQRLTSFSRHGQVRWDVTLRSLDGDGTREDWAKARYVASYIDPEGHLQIWYSIGTESAKSKSTLLSLVIHKEALGSKRAAINRLEVGDLLPMYALDIVSSQTGYPRAAAIVNGQRGPRLEAWQFDDVGVSSFSVNGVSAQGKVGACLSLDEYNPNPSMAILVDPPSGRPVLYQLRVDRPGLVRQFPIEVPSTFSERRLVRDPEGHVWIGAQESVLDNPFLTHSSIRPRRQLLVVRRDGPESRCDSLF